jgi:predicted DCC family thiol-disulfide oxidoreductase YuxK
LVNADKKRAFRYAPLQGPTAEAARAALQGFPKDLDTVVYVEDGKLYVRANAYFAAAKHLPLPWRAATWLRWLPNWLTDRAYGLIAERRYALFGKYESCRVPSVEERGLFLP